MCDRMQSLREQMLKAGLVTQEQVTKLENDSRKGRGNRRRRKKPTPQPAAKAAASPEPEKKN